MARTVMDAAKILQVIAGPDANDNYTLANPFGAKLPDYVAACKLSALQGKRIGIPRNVITTWEVDYQAPYIAAFNAAVSVIQAAGATVIDNTHFTAFEVYNNSTVPDSVLYADFISNLAKYLSELKTNPQNVHNLEEVRSFTQHFPSEDYPARDTGVWDAALAAGINNTSPEFWPLYQQNLYFGGEGGVLGALQKYNLDAVILPTDFAPSIPALVGAPVITVPLGAYPNGTTVQTSPPWGLVEAAPGIPFGISFMGARWSEETLIGMAYAFEQRTGARDKLKRYIQPHTQISDLL
jgi:amidase